MDSGFILDLEDVIYVPSMRRNLVSVGKLIKNKFFPIFNEDGFNINHKLNSVGSGLFIDGLFKLNCKAPFVSMNTVGIKRRISTNEASSKLWHKRLGHISKERMQTLTKTEILPPLDYQDMDVCVKRRVRSVMAFTMGARLVFSVRTWL